MKAFVAVLVCLGFLFVTIKSRLNCYGRIKESQISK